MKYKYIVLPLENPVNTPTNLLLELRAQEKEMYSIIILEIGETDGQYSARHEAKKLEHNTVIARIEQEILRRFTELEKQKAEAEERFAAAAAATIGVAKNITPDTLVGNAS